ncbi:523_t:CDS:2 [Cetraspora pellucida]|uniref:523_t:CDS:1 n=1 Tax=Cetraspora pellucida TaxID=1433469 RepID=A0A9N9AV33_9GLOM|nr:523_t:CDS:2 [Cetraspora pellucida]
MSNKNNPLLYNLLPRQTRSTPNLRPTQTQLGITRKINRILDIRNNKPTRSLPTIPNILRPPQTIQRLVLKLLQPKEEPKYIIKEVNQEVKEPKVRIPKDYPVKKFLLETWKKQLKTNIIQTENLIKLQNQIYYSTFLAYYYKYGSKELSSLEKEELKKAKEKLLTKLQEVGQEVTEIIEEEKLTRVSITIAPDTTLTLHTIKVKVPRRHRFIRTISEEELACLIIYIHELQDYSTYNLAVQQSEIAETRIQDYLRNAKIIKPRIY